jgi:hypothetical protein
MIIPERKICKKCGIEQDVKNFYLKKNKKGVKSPCTYCKLCYKEKNKQYVMENSNTDPWGLILQKPGKFKDQIEKNQTFEFLNSIGWQFNEEKNIWFKPGLKNEDGIWMTETHLSKEKHTRGEKISKEIKKSIQFKSRKKPTRNCRFIRCVYINGLLY